MRGVLLGLIVVSVGTAEPWPRHVIAEGYRNQTAIAADFTGDGKPDVIAGEITEGREKTILYAAPDWKPVLLYEGARTIHSAIIDVDRDGDPDFVGARYHPGLIYWLERPEDPLRRPWRYRVVDDAAKGGVDGIHGLLSADVDRDGKPDLIATSGQPKGAFPDSLAWFGIATGRGDPRWERHIFADRDATGLSHYLSFGDVNGDGRGDIASAAKDSPGGNWFAWWEQPADARQPWKRHWIAQNQPHATNIVIADLNGDRRPDLTGSRGHGDGITWFEAPDWRPHEIGEGLKGVHALAAGDIDRDGDTDLAFVAMTSLVAGWLENDGKGNFRLHRVSDNQSAYDLRLVDMDGDGDLDMLVAGFASNNVVWYENRIGR
jgi:hypothetical protein